MDEGSLCYIPHLISVEAHGSTFLVVVTIDNDISVSKNPCQLSSVDSGGLHFRKKLTDLVVSFIPVAGVSQDAAMVGGGGVRVPTGLLRRGFNRG